MIFALSPGSTQSWLWFTHPADWSAYDNAYGAGNDESACLRPENLTAGADGLVITARSDSVICATGEARDYTSGFLGGREADRLWPVEARFEIRARVPKGKGSGRPSGFVTGTEPSGPRWTSSRSFMRSIPTP